jgi:hypothetical protein
VTWSPKINFGDRTPYLNYDFSWRRGCEEEEEAVWCWVQIRNIAQIGIRDPGWNKVGSGSATLIPQFSILLSAEEEDVRKKRKLSDADGEEAPSKAARTEVVHPAIEPENRVPHPSGTSPAGPLFPEAVFFTFIEPRNRIQGIPTYVACRAGMTTLFLLGS